MNYLRGGLLSSRPAKSFGPCRYAAGDLHRGVLPAAYTGGRTRFPVLSYFLARKALLLYRYI